MNEYKMKLNGVFASDFEAMLFGDDDLITVLKTESMLQEANGKDVDVDLSSVGGLVDVGVDIFFMFRDYKRQYPTAQMQLNIKAQAASMASMFAAGEFWDLTTVEDISSWMAHNPSNYMSGDYRAMKQNAEYLERISKLYSGVYARRSNKSEKELQAMMDKTTYLFGQEIVDYGFADEVMKTESADKDKDSMIAQMQLKYDSTMEKLQQIKMQRKDLEKAVAILDDRTTMNSTHNAQQPAVGGNNNNQEEIMDIKNSDDLKKELPEIHADTMKAGEEKGRETMKASNKAIMEFKNKPENKALEFIQERCDDAIMNGESFDDLKIAVMALMLDPKNQASMESAGDINGGTDGTVGGETGSVKMTEAEIAKKESENARY